MITKEMLKRCLNVECRAFCALDEDVKEAICNNLKHAEYLFSAFVWAEVGTSVSSASVVRLSHDTPTEPEYEEKPITIERMEYVTGCIDGTPYSTINISLLPAIVGFLGIIYTLNGVETLRTSVDAAFGTPVRVRFAKGE